jgi:heme/copper-type cytochrome/quinol oxidase subunit 4
MDAIRFLSLDTLTKGKIEWCKWAALLAMTSDHVGMFMPQYSLLRIIGRMAFPLYACCIVSGAEKTRNSEQYLLRLLLMAMITQVPFSMVWGTKLNTLWTLALGLAAILLDKKFGKCCGLVVVASAFFMQISYSYLGIALVYGLWKLRHYRWELVLIAFCLAYSFIFKSMIELWGIAAIAVIMFGPEVHKEMKKTFWYPQFAIQYAAVAFIAYLRSQ